MYPPGAASRAVSSTFVLVLLLPGSTRAATSEHTHEAIVGKYHYDPAAVTAKPAAASAPPSASVTEPPPPGQSRPRVANPAERIPEQVPSLTPPPVGSATLTASGILTLPKMVVPGAKEKLPPILPQIFVRRPVRNVGKGDSFETPAGQRVGLETSAGRRARLNNKYYTPAEQKIAKLLHNSGAAAAEAAETAEQLNDLAYLIELSLAAGLESPEAQKEIRAEYYNLIADKPR